MASNSNGLNQSQQRHLRVSCAYVDKLLSDVEAVLWASASKSPFPKYIPETSPAQRRVIEDYIARIRARLVSTLESQHIPIDPPSIPATRAMHAALTFADIAVEELRPRYMRGYGEVPPAVATELNGIAGELEALVMQLDRFVQQGALRDLGARLQALETAGTDISVLRNLERVITERGLVEFRSTLSMILERLEDKSFEIAIFGRVSSGKSSLLNHILRTAVLPVGVTPITAVPTRLMYGHQAAVHVWYADSRPPDTFDISQLAGFVAEQFNPGNAKHVSRIMVAIPSPALREGVVFVDTPGLGSLATSGAAETLAYLPRCDLGVVLIDAASTLTEGDLHIVQTLYQAGIPANVLLSKSDLLSEADRTKILGYVQEHIRSELRIELNVHAVSVVLGHEHLLEAWFRQDIAPLYDRRQELKLQSVQRKIGMLRESVAAALRARLSRAEHISAEAGAEIRDLDAQLRRATARLDETAAAAWPFIEALAQSAEEALAVASAAVAESWSSGTPASGNVAHDSIRAFVQTKVKALQDALSSLAQHLTGVLNETAQKLQLADAPALGELAALLREMPAFDPSPFRTQLPRPAVAGFLGRRFAQRAAQRQLGIRVGASLAEALNTYAKLLGAWMEDVIGQMRRRFNAYADAYRAQLDRTLGGAEASPEDKAAIQAELRELSGNADVSQPVMRV
jgi:GTP-binding protein EngB required for normal cell division